MRYTFGMCFYNIDKLREHQGGEFLELPDSKEVRKAYEVLNNSAIKALERIKESEKELYIQNQVQELVKGNKSLRQILEETVDYYKDKK